GRIHREYREGRARPRRLDQGERRGKRQVHGDQRPDARDEILPMKSLLAGVAIAWALGASVALGGQERRTLQIYFVDVEGGQATLVVTPAGQSLLIDAGYPEQNGRDPDRILAAVKDARLSRIDYLLVTHLHEDHNGGVAELSKRIPIGTFVDYGSPVETAPEV